MSKQMTLHAVVAACNNMGIGINGKLPWRLKNDMAFFKKITSFTSDSEKKNVVIMGKNTWQSIPTKFRPLPNRINIILSTTLSDAPKDVFIAKNFDNAMDIVSSLDSAIENVFVIGGASVYRTALFGPYRCRLYLTRVMADFECDTFLPEISEKRFRKISNPDNVPSEEFDENGVKYHIEVYDNYASEIHT